MESEPAPAALAAQGGGEEDLKSVIEELRKSSSSARESLCGTEEDVTAVEQRRRSTFDVSSTSSSSKNASDEEEDAMVLATLRDVQHLVLAARAVAESLRNEEISAAEEGLMLMEAVLSEILLADRKKSAPIFCHHIEIPSAQGQRKALQEDFVLYLKRGRDKDECESWSVTRSWSEALSFSKCIAPLAKGFNIELPAPLESPDLLGNSTLFTAIFCLGAVDYDRLMSRRAQRVREWIEAVSRSNHLRDSVILRDFLGMK